jgi:nucleotide-binding universal stress UspA family protein
VLIVPPTERLRAWPSTGGLRIVAPLERSTRSAESLAPARVLSTALDAELLLLHVVERSALSLPGVGDGTPSASEQERLAEAERWRASVATQGGTNGLAVVPLAVIGDSPGAIYEVTEDRGGHLIVMATCGHSGAVRTLLGGVATGTVERSRVPLVLLGPRAIGGSARS